MKAKQKPTSKRSVKHNVKTKSKTNSKKLSINTSFLQRIPHKRWLLFASFFALVGASYLYFSKADSTFGDVPIGQNQIVVQYSLGMAHQLKENDLSATMPIPMLLYANGTMICGDTSQASMPNMPDMPVTYHAKQLSKSETAAVFNKLLSLGMQQAANFQRSTKFVGPTDAADLIVLNSTNGAYYATQYPGETNTAFQTIQHYLQSRCQQVTTTYNPSEVTVESVPANPSSQTASDLSDVSTLLKDSTTTATVGTKKLATHQSGQQASQLKTRIPVGSTGIYTVNGKKTKVRLMPKLPSYDYPKPFVPSSKNKVSAQANARSVRWLYVVPADMGTDGSEQGYLNELAGSIRDFYARNTGRTITISQISVVRGSKASWQYQQCPSGQTCSFNGANYPSLAVYFNMASEFTQDGVSTNVVYPFDTSDHCTGWGGPVASTNSTQFSYGISAFSRAGCYWYDGAHHVGAHENGHTYGLIHTCNYTIMDGLGSGCNLSSPPWSQITLDGGQAGFLAGQSPYFNSPPPTIDIFARGTDNRIYHMAWNGTGWNPWSGTDLPPVAANSSPVVSSWGSGRLDIFTTDTSNHLVHAWWQAGVGWASYWDYPGSDLTIVGKPAVVSRTSNNIDIFARGTDNRIYHKYWNGSSFSAWNGAELPPIVANSSPTVSSWDSGRLDVFTTNAKNQLIHTYWAAGSGWGAYLPGGWDIPGPGGTIVGDAAAVSRTSNNIDIFARGTDNRIYHKYWNGSSFSAWNGAELPPIVANSSPTVSSWDSGRLDIFTTDTSNHLVHAWWQANVGWAPGWDYPGSNLTIVGSPAVVSRVAK